MPILAMFLLNRDILNIWKLVLIHFVKLLRLEGVRSLYLIQLPASLGLIVCESCNTDVSKTNSVEYNT